MELETQHRLATCTWPAERRMKVAYVMSRFPKLSETFVLYEIDALRRQGVVVEVFPLIAERAEVMHDAVWALTPYVHTHPHLSLPILRAQGHFLRRQPRAYTRLWSETLRGTFGSANYMLGGLATLPKAVRFAYEMRAAGVTHVHAHFANHPTVAALAAHRLLGIPFSFTAHAHDLYVDQHMLTTKVRAAAFVVAISEYNEAFLLRHCGETMRHKIHVVHCGVDTDVFRPRPYIRDDDRFTIVCVGALEEKKGQTYLIEACRLLEQRGLSFVCRLVGEGPYRRTLEDQITQAGLDGIVRLEGGKSRDDVVALLNQADVVALPSVPTVSGRMEGIPVALMEPMACEKPVVSTRISGIPELVEDGVHGFLIQPHDSIALADALLRLAGDPALQQQFGRAGRRKILREFDLATNAARLLQLMNGVAR